MSPLLGALGYFLIVFVVAGEEAAGGLDILTTGAADSTDDAVVGEVVAEGFHSLLIRGGEVDSRDFVPADEVDTARETT